MAETTHQSPVCRRRRRAQPSARAADKAAPRERRVAAPRAGEHRCDTRAAEEGEPMRAVTRDVARRSNAHRVTWLLRGRKISCSAVALTSSLARRACACASSSAPSGRHAPGERWRHHGSSPLLHTCSTIAAAPTARAAGCASSTSSARAHSSLPNVQQHARRSEQGRLRMSTLSEHDARARTTAIVCCCTCGAQPACASSHLSPVGVQRVNTRVNSARPPPPGRARTGAVRHTLCAVRHTCAAPRRATRRALGTYAAARWTTNVT